MSVNSGASGSFLGLDRYSLQMSFMSYFRTGYPIVDQLIVTCLVGCILNAFNYLKPELLKSYLLAIWDLFKTNPQTLKINSVEITNKMHTILRSGMGSYQNNDGFYEKNHYLIQAFYLFMNKHINQLKNSEMNIHFTGNGDYNFQIMRNYSNGFRPKEPIRVGEFIITLDIDESIKASKSEDKQSENVIRNIKFTISSHLSTEKIHEFIKSVWNAYVDEEYPIKSISKKIPRYYIVRRNNGDNSYYVKYPLDSQITFDDVIFPEKERLLRRITQFRAGQTKLSRFSILLHGKPGGGKTSFIKALQNYTDCHVIVIKLSQFYVLYDLIEAFHKETLTITNGLKPENNKDNQRWETCIPIKDRIYLFEDIDAESDMVLSRNKDQSLKSDKGSKCASSSDSSCDIDESDSDISSYSESDSDSDIPQLTTSTDTKSSSNADSKASSKASPNSSSKKFAKNIAKATTIAKEKAKAQKIAKNKKSKKNKYEIFGKYDAINYHSIKLADILNLLDGVLELSGCFVVMTTNHPEKLDPALIREGRITYNIELGEIVYDDMRKMIHKFLPEYDLVVGDPIIDQKLKQLPKMMPCKFEQLVQHEIDLAGVLANINKILNSEIDDSIIECDNSSDSYEENELN